MNSPSQTQIVGRDIHSFLSSAVQHSISENGELVPNSLMVEIFSETPRSLISISHAGFKKPIADGTILGLISPRSGGVSVVSSGGINTPEANIVLEYDRPFHFRKDTIMDVLHLYWRKSAWYELKRFGGNGLLHWNFLDDGAVDLEQAPFHGYSDIRMTVADKKTVSVYLPRTSWNSLTREIRIQKRGLGKIIVFPNQDSPESEIEGKPYWDLEVTSVFQAISVCPRNLWGVL